MKTTVIFDMDGVLSDTEKIHAQIESGLLKSYGIQVSVKELIAEYAGVADREFFKEVFEKFRVESDIDEVIRKKWSIMMEVSTDGIEPIEGAISLIEYLWARGFKLAVASSSPSKFVDLVLNKLNIRQFFSAVASQDDVQMTKPDPEIFLFIAEELGVKPCTCLVIEDGLPGMIAARRAGMKCIGYIRTRTGERERIYPVDFVVENLMQISADPKIKELLGSCFQCEEKY
ncbi:HAD family hydrolase [Chloroflexota bacterium]